jgi:hypothetical protein
MPGMKARTIRKVLRGKLDSLLRSVDDKEVREILAENTIVTGGAIASMLLGEKINDFDLYFRSHEAALRIVQYYVDKFEKLGKKTTFRNGGEIPIQVTDIDGRIAIKIKSAGIAALRGAKGYQFFEMGDPEGDKAAEFIDGAIESSKGKHSKNYVPIFLSGNAITLSNDVQLIFRFYGEPEKIHENYDFVHCTNYWTSWDNQLVLNAEALESLLAKDLRYVGSLYPIASVIRTRKFVQRDWSCTAGQYLKMTMQCAELDWTDKFVLMDQLMGVDLAYFYELVQALARLETNEVDSTYLAQLIDELLW